MLIEIKYKSGQLVHEAENEVIQFMEEKSHLNDLITGFIINGAPQNYSYAVALIVENALQKQIRFNRPMTRKNIGDGPDGVVELTPTGELQILFVK